VNFVVLAPKLKTLGLARAPMLEIISRDPDRDIARSIETLAALGL